MPISAKINFFFKQGELGWSETYYAVKENTRAALDSAKTVMPFRVGLLGGIGGAENPRLAEIRVSDVAIERDSLTYNVPPADGSFSAGPRGAALVHSALLIDALATDRYRRSLMLRGFRQDLIGPGGVYTPQPGFVLNFNAFATKLKTEQWGILAITKPDAPLTFASFDLTAPNNIQIFCGGDAPPPVLVNQSVRISASPGVKGLRGNYIVVAVDGPGRTFRIQKTVTQISGVLRGLGKWYVRVPAVFTFTDIDIDRLTHRITGRPFDLPVGRRRRRAPA